MVLHLNPCWWLLSVFYSYSKYFYLTVRLNVFILSFVVLCHSWCFNNLNCVFLLVLFVICIVVIIIMTTSIRSIITIALIAITPWRFQRRISACPDSSSARGGRSVSLWTCAATGRTTAETERMRLTAVRTPPPRQSFWDSLFWNCLYWASRQTQCIPRWLVSQLHSQRTD